MALLSAEPALATAQRLFETLARETADPPGVTRASYGAGEAFAHGLIAAEADRIGLARRTDAVGNLYITLAGRDPAAPALFLGSHIDSVHHGGNFDGAAGVLAGLAVLERLAAAGIAPPFDITLMVIRAEEMVWFPVHYIGSRAAFGLLPPDTPDTACRSDSARPLAAHMADLGFDPGPIRRGEALLDPARIRGFIELHIEQGPVLTGADIPVGIVTAIRGNIRYRFARIEGETTHAGAVPRSHRRDAVLAGAELAAALEAAWIAREAAGDDLVLTLGEFGTDPARHGITKVPGALAFTLDIRSTASAVLDRFDATLRAEAERIARARGVRIALGAQTRAREATMDPAMRAGLHAAAAAAGIPAIDIASGGGHDAAVFAGQGVPSAMLFVRNANGSHNPDEAMDLADFAAAWQVLAGYMDALIACPAPQAPAPAAPAPG